MFLNTLKPAQGAKKSRKRVARGIGSGWGKTAGRGHKGQKSRSNSFSSIGFEGGQMPIQRRLPKVGFTSRKSLVTQEVRLGELNKVEGDVVSIETLQAAGIIRKSTLYVKVMQSGEINKAVKVEDENVRVSKGAADSISSAGGKVA